MSDFRRVSREQPCPICKKTDWCGVSADGVWCVCMRAQSDRRAKNGGWAHRLIDAPRMDYVPPPPKRKGGGNQLASMEGYHNALRMRWDAVWLDGLALTIGVEMDALERLLPAFDAMAQAFAFPMRDAAGKVVGIRLRNDEGKKWAVKGSSDGLFYDSTITTADEVVVCEGPTDTAAAMSMGLVAIGRSSCVTGGELIRDLVRRWRAHTVFLVADNDRGKRRDDGASYVPGVDGAESIVRIIGRRCKVVATPAKDIRAWYHGGGNKAEFLALARSAKWRLA